MELGYKVYFLESANDLDKVKFSDVENALSRFRQVVLLIDDVYTNPTHRMWIQLLKKCSNSNLVIVGTAVPPVRLEGITLQFNENWTVSRLLLSEDDEDMKDLIAQWQIAAPELAPSRVAEVCNRLREYTGGQIFPILKFCEYFFQDGRVFIEDLDKFDEYLTSAALVDTNVFKSVQHRCFQNSLNSAVFDMLNRVLSNHPHVGDVIQLTRLGFWDERKHKILSPLLLNFILKIIPPTGLLR